MPDIEIDAGTLLANAEDRSCTGLLIPYGEDGRSNIGRFRIGTGAFSLPADPSIATLNDSHARELPLGRATQLRETPQGVVATFSIARTPEGDQALADIASGARRHLSAEVADVVIRAGRAVSGRVFGAALVNEPAFPSATLLAAAADTDAGAAEGVPGEDPDTNQTSYETTETADDGSEVTTETTVTEEIEELDDGSQQLTRTTVAVTTITPPAGSAEGEAVVPQSTPAAAAAPAAAVPSTLLGTRRAPQQRKAVDRSTLYAMLAEATRTQSRTLLAELSDVTLSGAGSVGASIELPQWIGELWTHRTYQRRYVPLFGQGTLTSSTVNGWRWVVTPTVDDWDGDKTDVPSNEPTTEPYSEKAHRIAGAHDIGREFRDFDVPDFWDSYFRLMTESYARKSDLWVLHQALTAGNFTAVTGAAVPDGIAPIAGAIVDGALSFIELDSPSFAIVGRDAYRQLLLTPATQVLGYLSASLGLEDGSLEDFKIVPSGDAALNGANAGKALVGAPSAGVVRELGGSPIRVEALDMVKGGIDPGLFGYVHYAAENTNVLALVTPAA